MRRFLGALTFGLILLLVAGAGLTWRIVAQERLVVQERSRQGLEELADLVSVTLRSAISELEQSVAVLAAEGGWPTAPSRALVAPGVTVFLRTGPTVEVRPADVLLYRAWLPEASDEVRERFRRAEQAELARGDLELASARLRELLASADQRIRAGALVRLARVERKRGRLRSAGESYERLELLGGTAIGGLPAELIGLHGRCSLLSAAGSGEALLRCASELEERLLSGRLALSPGAFAFYRAEAARWAGESGATSTSSREQRRRLATTSALDQVWARSTDGDGAALGGGTASVQTEGRSFLLVWRNGAGGTAGLAASAEFFAGRLEDDVVAPLRRRGAALALAETDGSPMLVIGEPGAGPRIVRTAAEMDVPWNLSLSAAEGSSGEPTLRRWFVPGTFLVAVGVILAAAYAAYRAMHRELAVAGLQSDFVAAVSHEFRSPLASLRQMSEMLNEGRVRDGERRSRYLLTMEHETKRLQRLVEGLLDFARIEAGSPEFRMEPIDAAALVAGVTDEFRDEPMAEGRVIVLAGTDLRLPVLADRDALSRAVWNLLENAVKYSPDGGAIDVRVAQTGVWVTVSVEDRGLGIAPDEQRSIFGRFVRGRGAKSVSARGTGLGLAMVRQIVEAHDGRVSVASVLGEGSTFTIHLPVAEGES